MARRRRAARNQRTLDFERAEQIGREAGRREALQLALAALPEMTLRVCGAILQCPCVRDYRTGREIYQASHREIWQQMDPDRAHEFDHIKAREIRRWIEPAIVRGLLRREPWVDALGRRLGNNYQFDFSRTEGSRQMADEEEESQSGNAPPPPRTQNSAGCPPPRTGGGHHDHEHEMNNDHDTREPPARDDACRAGPAETAEATGVWRITTDSLSDPRQVAELYRTALDRGWITAADRLNFFAAAVQSLRGKSPPKLFTWLVKGRRWEGITNQSEERARAQLAELGAAESASARPAEVTRAAARMVAQDEPEPTRDQRLQALADWSEKFEGG